MFCSNCGAQIPDDSKFCPKCGHPVNNISDGKENHGLDTASGTAGVGNGAADSGSKNASAQKIPHIPAGNYGTPATGKDKKKPSGSTGKLIPIIAVCAAVILVIVIIAVNHKTTVNLSKYITITTEGYDTIGTAYYQFDMDGFSKDYDGKLKPNVRAARKVLEESGIDDEYLRDMYGTDNIADILKGDFFSNQIYMIYDGEVTPNKNLSNGDTVTFTWDLQEDDVSELEEMFNCRIKTEDVTTKVSGLQEVEKFDPFEGVTVTFDGIAPNGRVADISKGSDPICRNLSYSADKNDGLSNGDKITVSLSYYSDNEQEYFLRNYGKVPSETSKEFEVSGLSSYITTASDIPDDTLKQMQAEAEDAFNAKVASDWEADSTELVNFEYIGNYFLTAKDADTYSDHNAIDLIYKVRAHVWFRNDDGDSYDDNVDYYWYCRFKNILLTAEGDCSVDLTDYSTADNYGNRFTVDSGISNGWWGTKEWSFPGYQKLDLLYNQLVSQNIDKYKTENNVEDVSFGNSSKTASASGDAKSEGEDTSDSESSEETGEILPFSSDRELTEDDLDGLSKDELQTAINEIYARHGYTFKDPDILAYFEQFDWYEPTVAASDFSNDVLTKTESDNIKFIQEHMN